MKLKKYIFITLLIISTFLLSCSNILINSENSLSNTMKIHYIDVDQGDSILIQVNNKNLLIDAGPRDSSNKLFDYLEYLKIKKIDYIIATHPHEDHIGNMANIIKKYKIGSFYAPKVEHTSRSFERMIEELVNKNLKISVIKEGVNSINLGENTKITIYSPINEDYGDNLNLYSPIIKVEFIDTSFIFTGDAESDTENEVLEKNNNLKSNVLKLSHHGSSTSTSKRFYDAINPDAVVISVGKNNTYKHPSKKTLELLESEDPQIYRTDLDGTIILTSDGKSIHSLTMKYPYK